MKKESFEFEIDFQRLQNYIEDRHPNSEEITDSEFEKIFAEYQDMYPMNLFLFESKFECIFYDRVNGRILHYRKLPGTWLYWEKGHFFIGIKDVSRAIKWFFQLLLNKNTKNWRP